MPSRGTDAALIAPYLTHALSHHGQVTLVPPDNAGRVRQAKSKKNRNRPVPERNIRSDEDIRFNTGPRPVRAIASRGTRRSARTGRQDWVRGEAINSGNNDAIPDYPPPSFLEAISTPPVSVCPSTATLVNMTRSGLPEAGVTHHLPSPLHSFPRPIHQPVSSNNSDVDSDDSLEIIDMDSLADDALPSGSRLEEEVRRDWRYRRGVEFPPPSPRGRTRSRVTLDPDSEVIQAPENVLHQSPPTTPTRRHMSLSPLRTFFPYRPMNISDRALSAHPSPNSSPYSHSHSSFPFLSTTSLKMTLSTSSFLRLPLTPTSVRGENFMARTLSSFKGKERTRVESLEAWEVVDSEPPLTIMTSMVPKSPFYNDNKGSVRSQSFSHTSVPTTAIEPSPVNPQHSIPIHPLSARDRKVPPIPFVARSPRRPAPPPVRAHAPPSPSPPPVINTGPVLTSVRTRKNKPPPPPPKKKPQIISASPLGAESWGVEEEADAETSALQRAITIPLPSTPTDSTPSECGATSAASSLENILTPVPPVPQLAITVAASSEPLRSPAPSQIDQPEADSLADSHDVPMHLYLQDSSEGRPNIEHHYSGRPLPRPPGTTRTLVDSTYAGNDDFSSALSAEMRCPEGLLINLDDDISLPSPGSASTPLTDTDHAHMSATTSTTSSTEFLGSATSTFLSSDHTPSPILTPIATVPPPSSSDFLNVTDLDLFVSRLHDERRNGSDYETLLMLSEFIGPATPFNDDAGTPPTQPQPSVVDASPPNTNVALMGIVGVERRRVTKDGRTKLKLTLIDASVDKCGICLTQFKDEELARLGSLCRHAFHDKCLGRWLIRSKTCPMCRVTLELF